MTDTATQMFGKSMSLPDEPMRSWMELVTDLPEARIGELLGGHPRDAKVALAHAVVEGVLVFGADDGMLRAVANAATSAPGRGTAPDGAER